MKFRIAVAALALGSFTSLAGAQIAGKVNLDGDPPEMQDLDMSGVRECAQQHADPVPEQRVVTDGKGGLQNVIVAIKKSEGVELPGDVPSEPAVLDQKACMYDPHVLAMMTGQDFIVKNSDPFLHNVHTLSQINPQVNFGQPNLDPGKKMESPKAAEYFHVKCDVHPWMSAYIGVFEHPFFAVSKEDGTFSLPTKDLPDGDYTVTFWHEQYANDAEALPEVEVSVKDGKAEANHTFKAEAAMAEPQLKTIILASTEGEKKDGESGCGSCCSKKDKKLAEKKDEQKTDGEAKKDDGKKETAEAK